MMTNKVGISFSGYSSTRFVTASNKAIASSTQVLSGKPHSVKQHEKMHSSARFGFKFKELSAGATVFGLFMAYQLMVGGSMLNTYLNSHPKSPSRHAQPFSTDNAKAEMILPRGSSSKWQKPSPEVLRQVAQQFANNNADKFATGRNIVQSEGRPAENGQTTSMIGTYALENDETILIVRNATYRNQNNNATNIRFSEPVDTFKMGSTLPVNTYDPNASNGIKIENYTVTPQGLKQNGVVKYPLIKIKAQ